MIVVHDIGHCPCEACEHLRAWMIERVDALAAVEIAGEPGPTPRGLLDCPDLPCAYCSGAPGSCADQCPARILRDLQAQR